MNFPFTPHVEQSSGPVATGLAEHILGQIVAEPRPVDPWAAEELVELVRTAERHIAELVPFAAPAVSHVDPVDSLTWGRLAIGELAEWAEAFSVATETTVEARGVVSNGTGPVMAGAHLGAWAAAAATTVTGTAETGMPPPPGRVALVVPNIDQAAGHGSDGRLMRLWAAAHETAHMIVWGLPHVREAFRLLNSEHAVCLLPDEIVEDMASPSGRGQAGFCLDPSAMFGLLTERGPVERFLGVTTGMARQLAARAGDRLGCDLRSVFEQRGGLLAEPCEHSQPVVSVGPAAVAAGTAFLGEVSERFGTEATRRLWQPGGLPTPDETADPVGWAARVLIEDIPFA